MTSVWDSEELESYISMMVLEERLKVSRHLAVRDYGQMRVDLIDQWWTNSPMDSVRFANSVSPYHEAIEYLKQHEIVVTTTVD